MGRTGSLVATTGKTVSMVVATTGKSGPLFEVMTGDSLISISECAGSVLENRLRRAF